MKIETLSALADKIKSVKNAVILTHAHPDGDTVGAGFGLCLYLRSMGIKANVRNSEPFPAMFDYITKTCPDEEFVPETVISVDVADIKLLGSPLEEEYDGKIDLCIDHHFSNRLFAKDSYVDGDCCATCLIIYEMIKCIDSEMNISPETADCLYTGIATDTGCFMFEGASPAAHRAAAQLIERGAHAADINRAMFQTKSKGRILAEQRVISTMRFLQNSRIALISITNEIIDEFGIDRAELDGFAGIPLTVEGVKIGITLKQQPGEENVYKASIRTVHADASAIAAHFGGGGHIRAAGCTINGTESEVAGLIMSEAAKYL